jgi:hypothetical protein
MVRWSIVLIFCILPVFLMAVQGQQAWIVFYNVENLFDIQDDSLTKDEEFLPDGDKNWNYDRFRRKIVRIYQVMTALGEGEMPAVIGLCEIENRYVIDRLIYDTPLIKSGYRVVHRESPDARGVDVALLYRPDLFCYDTAEWLKVPLAMNETTREILHVTGRMFGTDTIHFYVNHWPSRYGGAGGSVPKRLAAASTLAASVKKVLLTDPGANLVIMGDFNDEPGDESVQAINKILDNNNISEMIDLINLSEKQTVTDLGGTIKHQGAWSVFDQILVSPALIIGLDGLKLTGNRADIFKADFLLEPDETYSGFKPFRTYTGPGYHDGFSDHLPVRVVIGKVGQ